MSTTHEVLNQAAPRVDLNEYTANPALVEAVGRYSARWATPELEGVGELVGRASFRHDAELANTNLHKRG